MVEEPAVAVVAIAVPPDLQPAIAQRALEFGKPVFLEKPLAADLVGARVILESARKSKRPAILDFNFPELPSWKCAKIMLDDGAIGRLQNVVVTCNFENQATRLRLEGWKTSGNGGGGCTALVNQRGVVRLPAVPAARSSLVLWSLFVY